MRKMTLTVQMWKYLCSRFAGAFGSSMLSFALGLYVLRQTGSALGMGVTMITGPLVSLVLTPFVGYVVDTMSHRKIVIIGQLATIIGLAGFALVFTVWAEQYYVEIIGLLIILQVTDNFFSTALQASLIELFEGEELQKVNSLSQSLNSMASFLAPIVGALLYTFVSLGVFAIIEVLFEVVALVGVLLLDFTANIAITESEEKTPEVVTQKEGIWENFRVGFQYLRKQKLISIVMLVATGVNFFFAAENLGMPYLLVTKLKLTDGEYGIVTSTLAIGMFVGGLIFSVLKIKKHPVIFSFSGMTIMGVILIVIGVPENLGWSGFINTAFYVLINVVMGVTLIMVNTPISVFMQTNIDPKFQGRVFSIMSTMAMLLMPLGTIVFGALFDHMSAMVVFAIVGGLLILMMLGIRTYVKKSGLIEDDEREKEENAQTDGDVVEAKI